MSAALQELLEKKGTLAVLRVFGLDQVLTDQDDPGLWASVLAQHWPAPWEPDIDPAALRFGIGRIISAGEESVQSARSGMEPVEEWCFERIDSDRLQVMVCGEVPKLSFMAMIASGNPSAMNDPESSWARGYLDISRPSHNHKKALVHNGMSIPPNAGSGETRHWEKIEDGSWVETEEVFSQWLA